MTGVLFPIFRGLPCAGLLSTSYCVTLGTVLHSGLKHQVLRLLMSTSNGLVMLFVFEQHPTDTTLTANLAKRSYVGCKGPSSLFLGLGPEHVLRLGTRPLGSAEV